MGRYDPVPQGLAVSRDLFERLVALRRRVNGWWWWDPSTERRVWRVDNHDVPQHVRHTAPALVCHIVDARFPDGVAPRRLVERAVGGAIADDV